MHKTVKGVWCDVKHPLGTYKNQFINFMPAVEEDEFVNEEYINDEDGPWADELIRGLCPALIQVFGTWDGPEDGNGEFYFTGDHQAQAMALPQDVMFVAEDNDMEVQDFFVSTIGSEEDYGSELHQLKIEFSNVRVEYND